MSIPRVILMFILLVFVYGGTHFYITRRFYQWLIIFIPNMNIKIYIGIFIFLALSMFLAFIPFPSGIKLIIDIISAYWIGTFVYLLLFTIAADLILLLVNVIKIIPNYAARTGEPAGLSLIAASLPQKVIFFKGLIVFILSLIIVGYGLYNARQIRHVSYDIKLRECNTSLSSEIKIVMISDLHLGEINSEKNLPKIIQGINEMEPDIVCIVGDIFNDDFNAVRNPEKAIELFRSIKSTYGVYACLGNHDGGRTLNDMKNFLYKSNITLLNDDFVTIDDRLILAGRLDASPIGGFGDLQRKDTKELMAFINTELPVVVMDHNPSNINQYGKETDLILSGHTHRGQIFPGRLFTNAIFTVDYGYYQKDSGSPHVIVTSGAGTWGTPMRIGTNNEIVSIRLR